MAAARSPRAAAGKRSPTGAKRATTGAKKHLGAKKRTNAKKMGRPPSAKTKLTGARASASRSPRASARNQAS